MGGVAPATHRLQDTPEVLGRPVRRATRTGGMAGHRYEHHDKISIHRTPYENRPEQHAPREFKRRHRSNMIKKGHTWSGTGGRGKARSGFRVVRQGAEGGVSNAMQRQMRTRFTPYSNGKRTRNAPSQRYGSGDEALARACTRQGGRA